MFGARCDVAHLEAYVTEGPFVALTAEVATADVIPACVRRRRQPRWNASAKRRSVGERWRGRQRRSADTGIGSPSCAL